MTFLVGSDMFGKDAEQKNLKHVEKNIQYKLGLSQYQAKIIHDNYNEMIVKSIVMFFKQAISHNLKL